MRHADYSVKPLSRLILANRKPRYFLSGEKWYFQTREKDVLGPYDCILDAQSGAEFYVELVQDDASNHTH